MVTGQDHALVQHNRLTFTRLFHFRVTRYTPGCRSRLVNVGIYQTEFQRRGCAQNFFRTRGILNTRQFDHNAVSTLTLYHGLSNTQLVNTITQNVDVLLYCVFTGFAQARIGHYRTQSIAALAGNNQILVTFAQVRDSFITGAAITESDAQTVVIFFANGSIRNAFFTQIAAQAIDILFLQLTQRGVHIHFHQEVNAATQVKTEFHRFCVNGSQPAWGCRSKVKRHDVLIAQYAH